MAHKPQILLFGESVFMDSVAESLVKRESSSSVIRVNSLTNNTWELVNSLNPDLIVWELDTQNSNSIFTIIREQADTMHMAIDLTCQQIILLDCQRRPAESMQELCDLVNQEIVQGKITKEVLKKN